MAKATRGGTTSGSSKYRHHSVGGAGAAAMAGQSLELVSLTDAADQAESRVRPLSRRALMIERPARVCIRARKPCLRARRRVFGW